MATLNYVTLLFLVAIGTFFEVTCFIPFFIYRKMVILFVKVFKPDLGPILEHMSGMMEDDHCHNPNNSNLVCILSIKGDLTLTQLQTIFEKNVLQAKLSKPDANRCSTLRYPELRWYPVNFLGHRFWKRDPHFRISKHVNETTYNGVKPSLSELHKERLNMTFREHQSPWEVNLVRNYVEAGTTAKTSLIILRIHHSLADGKSLVKFFVEALGQKKLQSPEAKFVAKDAWQKLKFYLTLPYNLVQFVSTIYITEQETYRHPWRIRDTSDKYEGLVGISPKISMEALKTVAKRNSVKVSPVIMSIVCGAIMRLDEKLGIRGGLPVYYTLPKEGHPEYMTNHVQLGIPKLPTDELDPIERLKKCHQEFERVRFSDEGRIADITAYIFGTLTTPLRLKIAPITPVTAAITNIAGDGEGFAVGGFPCTDFTFCTAITPSVSGVLVTVFSYKENIRLYVTAKNTVMDERQVEKLAELIGTEAKALLGKV